MIKARRNKIDPDCSAALGPVGTTERGFELIEFVDKYGEQCSLQQSSVAGGEPGSSAVWLGCDEARRTPEGEPLSPRMHLDRRQVAVLIAHLQRWLDANTFSLSQSGDEMGSTQESQNMSNCSGWLKYLYPVLIALFLYGSIALGVFQWRNPKSNDMSFFRHFWSVMTWEQLDEYQ